MSASVGFLERKPMGTSVAASDLITKPRVVAIDGSPRFEAEPIQIDSLYPEASVVRPILGHALRGLAAEKDAVQESLEALKRGELISSDESMQRLQALLPELFYCRDLGDGFGAIINALKFSFENAHGAPFSEGQIRLIGQVVERIRQEPFLQFEDAAELVGKLDDVGLTVDPPGLAALGELVDVEGLR
jgi:hypothetical protein